MTRLAGLFLLIFSCVGQTLNPTLSTGAVPPGGATTLSVTFADAATPTNIVGFEWGVGLPAGVTIGPWTPSPATRPLTCNGLLCVVVPVSPVAAMTTGVLGTAVLSISSTAVPGSYQVTLNAPLGATTGTPFSALVAVDINNSEVAVTTVPATLIILSKYDLNSDGVVNNLDVQMSIQQALKLAPCTNGDVDKDGKCSIKDAVAVIYASLGKIPL